jgi:Protein of unknown function (DUF2855)
MSSHDATAARLLVRRCDLAQLQLARPCADTELPVSPGQVRLRVERFALTASNITYAAVGEAMHHWQFFPAPDGRRCTPVWGFAKAAESASTAARRTPCAPSISGCCWAAAIHASDTCWRCDSRSPRNRR